MPKKSQSKPIKVDLDYENSTTTQGAYPSSDDLAFIAKVQGWWDEADKSTREAIEEEKDDHAFAWGHQWDAKDISELEKTGRAPLVINKVRPTIQVVSGHERSNRMRVRYLPVEHGDDFKAEVWSECARITQEKGDIDYHKSDAFADMLRGGRGFLELRFSYRDNPAGEIVGSRVLPWEIRLDPTSTAYDLSDCRYWLRAKDVSYEILLEMWPDKKDEILNANTAGIGLSQNGNISNRTGETDYDNAIKQSYNKDKNTWQLLEVWYFQIEETGKTYQAKNPDTGDWETVKDEQSLLALLMFDNTMEYKTVPEYGRRYYQAFIAGPVLLEHHPSPYNLKGYNLIPIFGEKDEKSGRFTGMVTPMRDPQMEINKRRVQILHIINKAAKSGWYGPKGAFVDRDQWEEESARPGVILEYDTMDGQPPQPIQPPTIPAAFIQLEQMASVDIRDVSGVNIELMGLSQKDTPGIVTNQRQRQALTILQNYFDALQRSTKLMGRVLLSMMMQLYTDGRVMQITGITDPQTQQPINQIQLTKELAVGRYDLIAEESPYSPNQKMETAAKLMQVIDVALKAGLPVPPDCLDYLDLPVSFTTKWKQMIQQKMEAAQQGPPPDPRMIEAQAKVQENQARLQMDMQKFSLELQQMQADIKKTLADGVKSIAQAEAAEFGPQLEQYGRQMDMLSQMLQAHTDMVKARQDHEHALMQQDQAQQAQAQQQPTQPSQ